MLNRDRTILLIALLSGMIGMVACSGPSVSGFGLITRTVRQGDTVTVKLPFDPDEGKTWRIARFDSMYISPFGQPTITQQRNGEWVYTARFTARSAGSTKIVFHRDDPASRASGKPDTRSFTVRILPR